MSKDSKCKEKLSTYFTTIGPSTTNYCLDGYFNYLFNRHFHAHFFLYDFLDGLLHYLLDNLSF